MDKIIVTVMLIIGGIVAAFATFNSVYPAIERSGSAIGNASDTLNDRIKSDIAIIQVNDDANTVYAWVKNIGTSEILAPANSDVFYGTEGNFSRIPFGDSSTALPYWTYQVQATDSRWTPSCTNEIMIHLASEPLPGTYLFKFIIPNGIFDEVNFGVN